MGDRSMLATLDWYVTAADWTCVRHSGLTAMDGSVLICLNRDAVRSMYWNVVAMNLLSSCPGLHTVLDVCQSRITEDPMAAMMMNVASPWNSDFRTFIVLSPLVVI